MFLACLSRYHAVDTILVSEDGWLDSMEALLMFLSRPNGHSEVLRSPGMKNFVVDDPSLSNN